MNADQFKELQDHRSPSAPALNYNFIEAIFVVLLTWSQTRGSQTGSQIKTQDNYPVPNTI